ncbi:hypothetical protein SAMN05216563_1277 [Phytobacter palmae]|nr:hypothetical protein SAMN05216563_1277 [Phytobacter palmae]
MRKLIVFFNGGAPYSVEVGEHLNSLRLAYPDQTEIDLPIRSCVYPGKYIMEEHFYVSDRDVTDTDIINAIDVAP